MLDLFFIFSLPVERRRRFNINDRIKELGTLLPTQNEPYYELVRGGDGWWWLKSSGAYNLDWFSAWQGARREAEQGEHPEGVGGLHQAAEEGSGEEERGGGEVQEAGAEPQEGASQDTGESSRCFQPHQVIFFVSLCFSTAFTCANTHKTLKRTICMANMKDIPSCLQNSNCSLSLLLLSIFKNYLDFFSN